MEVTVLHDDLHGSNPCLRIQNRTFDGHKLMMIGMTFVTVDNDMSLSTKLLTQHPYWDVLVSIQEEVPMFPTSFFDLTPPGIFKFALIAKYNRLMIVHR